MNISICENMKQANLTEMREVYASVGWMKHTNDRIKQVFEASNVIALAKADGRSI